MVGKTMHGTESAMGQRINDPLFDAPPARVQLDAAPLARVLGQIQFAKIIKITNEAHIGDFQELVRDVYPIIEREVVQSVELNMEGGGISAQTSDEVVWRLFDRDKVWRVSLSPSALSLETRKYTSRHDFLARLEAVAGAFGDTLKPALATRVGFRYVNHLVKSEDLAILNQLIHRELIGVLADCMENNVHQTISFAQCRTADGTLLARWGKLPPGASHDPDAAPPRSTPSWILDIDSFAVDVGTDRFDPTALTRMVEKMADRAYAFFRWCVTDEFIDRFGGKP